MMSNSVIVQNVSKSYSPWGSASERFWSLFRSREPSQAQFWALQDVSFTVPKGAALGLVGRNGAGKSTLLQIIAGTVQPTRGRVQTAGRVAPLLELGAGFNPDFTGWENIHLAGSILGVADRDLRQRAVEIAEFAELGDFMKRPVKTYSSGMFARLAFSVAVHVDPDILLVDEILSVGDLGFQQRCLARLRRLRERGVTLLFVSHAPDAIKSVCDRAIFVDEGRLVFAGTADETVDRYLAFIREHTNKEQLATEKKWVAPTLGRRPLSAALRYGSGHAQFMRLEIRDEALEPCRAFALGAAIVIDAEIESGVELENLSVSFLVRDATGVDILGTTTFDEGVRLPSLSRGDRLSVQFTFRNPLRPGNYGISLAVNRVSRRDYTDNILLDQVDGGLAFAVMDSPGRPIHYKVHLPVEITVAETRTATPNQSQPHLLHKVSQA